VSAALDPLDPADFRVMWEALDDWGRAWLLGYVRDGAVSAPSLTGGSG
jgi:hypothetical protein